MGWLIACAVLFSAIGIAASIDSLARAIRDKSFVCKQCQERIMREHIAAHERMARGEKP